MLSIYLPVIFDTSAECTDSLRGPNSSCENRATQPFCAMGEAAYGPICQSAPATPPAGLAPERGELLLPALLSVPPVPVSNKS